MIFSEIQFRDLHALTAEKIKAGERDLGRLFSDADREFLSSIGSKPIEMFDAADDWVNDGAPTLEEMLEIHRIRFDYFTRVQKGFFPTPVTEYRAKNAELGGIRWLPRAIDKVKAKVSGRLLDDFFYPCAGDRGFLRGIRMSAPDFFRLVVDSSSDEEVLSKLQSKG